VASLWCSWGSQGKWAAVDESRSSAKIRFDFWFWSMSAGFRSRWIMSRGNGRARTTGQPSLSTRRAGGDCAGLVCSNLGQGNALCFEPGVVVIWPSQKGYQKRFVRVNDDQLALHRATFSDPTLPSPLCTTNLPFLCSCSINTLHSRHTHSPTPTAIQAYLHSRPPFSDVMRYYCHSQPSRKLPNYSGAAWIRWAERVHRRPRTPTIPSRQRT